MEELKLFKQGAEARLFVCDYLGKPTLMKERFVKTYRHPALDTKLTNERIKHEARAILRCKKAEIKTPCLYLVDMVRRRIYMEYLANSITVRDFIITVVKTHAIGEADSKLDVITRMVGETIRKMHDNRIIHGDLTTSNMLLVPKEDSDNDVKGVNPANLDLVMIDFGLSFVDIRPEAKGVDLYVLERAIISTHNDVPGLFDKILEAYKNFSTNNTKEIMTRFAAVRARGRKRTMVG